MVGSEVAALVASGFTDGMNAAFVIGEADLHAVEGVGLEFKGAEGGAGREVLTHVMDSMPIGGWLL